ncbi:MAG: type I 3-dehydroquinate dehydratase [Pseudobutyrivibrio sp.]|nr:type I 3-dehydroquinate dehydratase [Pseudobutyrivibrio sp.]
MTKQINVKGYSLSKDKPMICIPIVENSANEIISKTKMALEAGARMIEFRADYFDGLTDEVALKELLHEMCLLCQDVVLLFTIRSVREGGRCSLEQSDIEKILFDVAKSDYVDLIDYEFSQNNNAKDVIAKLKENGIVIIASHHDFDYTPSNEDLEVLFERMDSCGADIVKVAVMPRTFQDALRMMDISNTFDISGKHPIITMSMGELGKISRVACRFTGSIVTYASLDKSSAPGQIAFKDMIVL